MQHNHFPKKFSMIPRPMQQNSVPQTGCRQPIILTKFVAEQIMFHKRVAGNPLFSLYLLLFQCKQILFHKRIASNPLFMFHKRVAGNPLF